MIELGSPLDSTGESPGFNWGVGTSFRDSMSAFGLIQNSTASSVSLKVIFVAIGSPRSSSVFVINFINLSETLQTIIFMS